MVKGPNDNKSFFSWIVLKPEDNTFKCLKSVIMTLSRQLFLLAAESCTLNSSMVRMVPPIFPRFKEFNLNFKVCPTEY